MLLKKAQPIFPDKATQGFLRAVLSDQVPNKLLPSLPDGRTLFRIRQWHCRQKNIQVEIQIRQDTNPHFKVVVRGGAWHTDSFPTDTSASIPASGAFRNAGTCYKYL